MVNRKKLKQILFFFMFFNCCIVLSITSISLSTDYWVLVRPYRKQPLIDLKTTKSSEHVSSSVNKDDDYLLGVSSAIDEDSVLLPFDFSNSKNDCKRYNGKIRYISIESTLIYLFYQINLLDSKSIRNLQLCLKLLKNRKLKLAVMLNY